MAFVQKMNGTKLASINCLLNIYEAWVCFRIRVQVRVRNSTIFEKVGCGVQQLKNYYLYFLYMFTIKIFLKNTLYVLGSQSKERRRQETQDKKENTKEVTNIQNKIEEGQI